MAFMKRDLTSDPEILSLRTQDPLAEVLAPGYITTRNAGDTSGNGHGLRVLSPRSQTSPQIILVLSGDAAPLFAYVSEITLDGRVVLKRFEADPTPDLPPMAAKRGRPPKGQSFQELN
jgi:hypothetical protein